MPIIRDVVPLLKAKDILRREGIREHGRLRPEIKTIIRDLVRRIGELNLVEPAILYETYPVLTVTRDGLTLQQGTAFKGPAFFRAMPHATELAAVVCSIGPKLEIETRSLFDRGEPLRALLLDGLGSAAVDSVAQQACRTIARSAESRGCQASSPVSPGMPGFPISEQRQLIHLLPSTEIGVAITSAGVMTPQKSVSMVLGIGTQVNRWTQADVCAHCNLRKTCAYRIGPPVPKGAAN